MVKPRTRKQSQPQDLLIDYDDISSALTPSRIPINRKELSVLKRPADQLEKRLSISERMFRKARVVTMEPKYAISHQIAEFYCTITSPAFALPALMYLYQPTVNSLILFDKVPDIDHLTSGESLQYSFFHHLCLWFSIFTATMSTKYHQSLCKVYSSLDAGFATVMAFLLTASVWKPHVRMYHRQLDESLLETCGQVCLDFENLFLGLSMPPFIILLYTFVSRWDKSTAMLATNMISFITPFLLIGTRFNQDHPMSSFVIDLIGLSAAGFFLLDRKGYAMTHSLWHILGGIYMLLIGLNSFVIDHRIQLQLKSLD